jgi:N-acyl-phosphatidylethanolamine-hydrolysing phospholipase D
MFLNFSLSFQGNKFWFGGDTAYSDVFEQIGRRFGHINLAAIPIGAYNPRKTMRFVHVNPEEAVQVEFSEY